MMKVIAVEPSLTMEKQEHESTLTLCGGGNVLFVHLGAVHRLYELGCLNGIKICRGLTGFTAKEQDILDDWNKRAKNTIKNSESFPDAFGAPLRNFRKKRWWRLLADRVERIEDWRATLRLSRENDVCWGANDGFVDVRGSLRISAERHEEMHKLALSTQYLSELGADYLIDWGYVLCDAALLRRCIGIASEDWSSVSPNRLFYRSFEHLGEAFAVPEVSSGLQAEEDKAMVRRTDVKVNAA